MLLVALSLLFLGLLGPAAPAAVLETTAGPNVTTASPLTLKEIEKQLEGTLTSITKMALPYLVQNSDLRISSACMSTFIKMFVDVRKLKVPVMKLLDAMGKPPFGLLEGTFTIMGDYDECLDVRATKKGDIARTREEEYYHGQYCMVKAGLPASVVQAMSDYNNGRANASTLGKLGGFIAEFPASNFAGDYFTYHIGLCVPSTCSADDLREMLKLIPESFVPIEVSYCDDGSKTIYPDQIAFIVFLALFGSLVLIGTLLEGWFYLRSPFFKGHHKDKCIRLLMAFSVYANTRKFLQTKKHGEGADIPVVNGMYVTGTFLVILYHVYFMPFFLKFSSHGSNLGYYLNDFFFTPISVMGISIEAYFLFSGLFLSYPRFRRQEKEVNINVIKIIVRRYIRLCPSMLLVLGIIVVLPLLASGPVFADIFGLAAENTRKFWYTYALMYNNFLEVKDQNFLYFWFIPCLMQLTIAGSILLWIISKYPKLGISLTILCGLVCNVVLGVFTAVRHYPPTYAVYWYYDREHFEETIYTAPLSHFISFGIGMILGYYMAKYPTLKWSKVHVVVGWIASICLTSGIQFLVYLGHEGKQPNPVLAAIYASTHRGFFSLGLSWIILACTNGYGGIFARVMGWKGFAVLSKLGYFGYLIHYIVLAFHASVTRVPLMYSHYEIVMRTCGYTLITFFAAYVLYITFELPLVYVESLFLPARPSEKTSTDPVNNAQVHGHIPGNKFSDNYNGVFAPVSKITINGSLNTEFVNKKAEHSKL